MDGWFANGVLKSKLGKVLLAVACATVLVASLPSSAVQAKSQPSLSRQKLEVEVDKLEAEVRNSSGLRGFFSQYAGVLTALGALLAVGVAFVGQSGERNRQRKADRNTHKLAIEQREAESNRDLTARFSKLLLDLGSESEAVQAGAAVSLLSFLGQDPTFHHQVRLATIANLRVPHPEAITKLLRRTFEQAMSIGDVPYDAVELDLSEAHLGGATLKELVFDGANLSGTDLEGANLSGTSLREAVGEGVNLSRALIQGKGASLFNARLIGAKCVGARFEGAEMVNAHLKGADLRMARFDGARMQAAHLEFGDFRGARFDGANVADTYLIGAKVDDDALHSLLNAKNWEKAHLSADDAQRLYEFRDERRAEVGKYRRPNEKGDEPQRKAT